MFIALSTAAAGRVVRETDDNMLIKFRKILEADEGR
jgi:hypothetical protein